jgi:hypothetical protein
MFPEGEASSHPSRRALNSFAEILLCQIGTGSQLGEISMQKLNYSNVGVGSSHETVLTNVLCRSSTGT